MRSRIINKLLLALTVAVFLVCGVCGQAVQASALPGGNPAITLWPTKHVVQNTSSSGLGRWTQRSAVQTVVGPGGVVSVMCDFLGQDIIEIHEYSPDLVHKKVISIPKEMPMVGAFTRDSKGNYYVFYAKEVQEGATRVTNMALVQYTPEGKRFKAFFLESQPADSFAGVKVPFDAGSCRMEISGDKIAVYFGREMFKLDDGLNHQASYGFVLDINTFKKLTGSGMNIPYASHSFNQFILADNDGFVFVDHGDAYPRSFLFTKLGQPGTRNKEIVSFVFKDSAVHYNNTFAEMGGIVSNQSGYMFAGTYEKNSKNTAVVNDSRNIFLLTIDKNFTKCSSPIWLTEYNDKDKLHAVHPKIVALDNHRAFICWEVATAKSEYVGTYGVVVDEKGEKLGPITEMSRARLNADDVLRVDPSTGRVYWAVGKGDKFFSLCTFQTDVAVTIPSSGTVTVNMPVLADANASAKVLGNAKKGDVVEFDGYKGSFAAVTWNGKKGYIAGDRVRVEFGAAKIGKAADGSYVYQAPKVSLANMITSPPKNQAIWVSGFVNDFCVVDWNGKSAYIPIDNVTCTLSTPIMGKATQATKFYSRNNRAAEFELGTLSKNQAVTLVARQGKWWKVKVGNQTGFVLGSLVKLP